MALDGRTQRKVGEDIAVVGDERLVPHKCLHIFDAPAGVKEDGLVPVFERQSPVVAARQKPVISLRAVVGVDGERCRSARNQVVESECDQRLAINGNERFGAVFGERPQPGPQPGTKHKRFHGGKRQATAQDTERAESLKYEPVPRLSIFSPWPPCSPW